MATDSTTTTGTEKELTPVPSKKKKLPIRYIILAIFLITGILFGYSKWKFAHTHEETDNATVETWLMPVLPRTGGFIKSININDYDSAKAGSLLVEIDDAEMQAQLQEMDADLRSTMADIANAQASLNQAIVSLGSNKGNVSLNQLRINKAQQDYTRDASLYQQGAITKKQLDDSKFTLDQARQQLNTSISDFSGAQSRIAVLQSAITKAQASLDLKKARIEQQKLKLSYTKITAPISGKIGKRNISIGQFVQAGTPLFTIVNDSTYWIIANFKESQISKFRAGMPVDISIDAYPDIKFKGIIESLSDATGAKFALLPPENASGNFVKVAQRIPVKITINDVEKYRELMRAGLSATVTVPLK